MTLEEIYTDFINHISEINYVQRIIRDEARKHLIELKLNLDRLSDEDRAEEDIRLDRFSFFNILTKENETYGHTRTSSQKLWETYWVIINKQYRWLLVEAYEEFEEFSTKVFAYSGTVDIAFWGKEKCLISDINRLDYDWFYAQAKEHKEKPERFLKVFREHLPTLSKIESNNQLHVNLKFVLLLVQHLRHIIVHKSGRVSDKEALFRKIYDKAALGNNNQKLKECRESFDVLFGENEYQNEIVLIEIPDSEYHAFGIQHEPYTLLVSKLVLYANLIKDLLSEHLSSDRGG